MIATIRSGGLAFLGLLFGTSIAAFGQESPSKELLRFVPADMAVCLVIDDFSGHYQRFIQSPQWHRVRDEHLGVMALRSPAVQKLVAVQSLAPIYLGITAEQLRDQILGNSVVLAFRPAKGPEEKDSGIFLCRATDETVLRGLIDRLVALTGDGRLGKRQHRGIEYYHRMKPTGGPDFLLQVGTVAALSDKESAIQSAIDAHLDKSGLAEQPVLREIVSSLPAACLVRLMVNPRAFDEVLARQIPAEESSEAISARFFAEQWRALRWLAVTIHFDAGAHFGLHFSADAEKLGPVTKQWFAGRASGAWLRRIPADALAAGAIRCDFEALAKVIGRLAAAQGDSELREFHSLIQQLLAGYDLGADLLPALGPDIAFAVVPGNAWPGVVGMVQFTDRSPTKPGELSLAVALESALRPIFIAIAFEHNKKRKDALAVKLEISDGVRIHYLSGSRILPGWLQPCFAIHDGFVAFATTPADLKNWIKSGSESSLVQSTLLKQLTDGTEAVSLHAFVNVQSAHRLAQALETKLVEVLVQGQESRRPRVRQEVASALALFRDIDRIILQTRTGKAATHCQFSILPRGEERPE